MKLFCNHCFKDVELTLTIKGPHVTANCRKCGRYIKHFNSAERAQALQEGMVVKGGGTNKQSGDRNVSDSKEPDQVQYKKTDNLPGVW